MASNALNNLREWARLTDLLNKIPLRVQKGFLYQELNITCVDVLPAFIALGTDAGIVFWYNRSTGDVQKLKTEFTSPVTCLKIISSVEYMVAAGCASGQVTIFQIQKEHPPDLNLVTPMTKPKPIERYTIRDLHQTPIRCVEWSKNGMKLFSGDKQGIIVLTEFDFQAHISKSIEILNEAYDIVQICFYQPWLLISTVYRAIICEKERDGNWKVSQVGKKDRKTLSDFGVAFMGSNRNPSVICGRPGFRFWIADTQGNVSQTFLLKDAISRTSFEVPLLNPGKLYTQLPTNFGRCFVFMERFIVTHNDNIIYFLNLEKLRIEATIKRLRNIISLSVCGSEIFILEGPRILIRISTIPEPPNKTCSKILFNPAMAASNFNIQDSLFQPPVEFEAEEETVVNAEECFELPPIEHIDLEIPLRTALNEHDLLKQDKLFLEHSKKAEIFEKINQLDYDDSILFKTKKKQKSKSGTSGIVEIGQQAELLEENKLQKPDEIVKESANKVEQTTRPCLMNASFCDGASIVPDLRSPDTISKVLESKEKLLAAALNLEPINCDKIQFQSVSKLTPDLAPEFHYSIINYPSDVTQHTTPLKRLHFIKDDYSPSSEDVKLEDFKHLCDDMKNVVITSDASIKVSDEIATSSTNIAAESIVINPDVPEVKQMPEYMHIPNLWNVRIVKSSETKESESSDGNSEWEFVDM